MCQMYSTNVVKISNLLRVLWAQQNSNLSQRTEMASEHGLKVLKILFKKTVRLYLLLHLKMALEMWNGKNSFLGLAGGLVSKEVSSPSPQASDLSTPP